VIKLSDTASNNNLKNVYLLALLFALSLLAVYYFQTYYKHFMNTFSTFFPLFIAGATFIASVLALRNYWESLESVLSRIWLGFTLGMAFWLLSELSRCLYTVIFQIKNPYPSVADVYRLIGYGFLLFAIFTYVKLFRPVISKKMVATASIFILPTSTGIVPVLLLSLFATAPKINLTTLIVSLLFPFLDLALLSQAMLGLLVFTTTQLKGKIGSAWLLINAGIIMNVFGDLLFSYMQLKTIYYRGHPLELFFHFGYLFFMLSFYTHVKKL
jgi:hypothetical protein